MQWVLMSMTLALLALAVFAGPARAEGEGIKEYNPKQELFLPESANTEHQETETNKKTTPTPTTNPGSEPTETTGVEETVEPEESAAPPLAPGGGNHPGPGHRGKPKLDDGAESSAQIGVGENIAVGYRHPNPTPDAPVTATLPSSTGGGSSPLVPVLVAIAILAAISIGAVIYRHRREQGDRLGSA